MSACAARSEARFRAPRNVGSAITTRTPMTRTTTISSIRVNPRSSFTPLLSVVRRTNLRRRASYGAASIRPARVSEQADDAALKALPPQGACGFESPPGHAGWCSGEPADLLDPIGGELLPVLCPDPVAERVEAPPQRFVHEE